MKKTRKPKYYVAQVGTNTSNYLHNNPVDQAGYTLSPITSQIDRGNMYINTEDALPTMPEQSQQLGNPGIRPQRSSNRTQLNSYVQGFNSLAQGATAIAGQVDSINASKDEYKQYLKARQGESYNNMERYGLNGLPAYTQYGGTASKYQMGGNLTYSDPENDDYSGDILEELKAGGWIKGAVNPAHKGYCTPMTKSTCTPRRKAFAMTMKKHHGFHKAQTGGQQVANISASQAASGNTATPAQPSPYPSREALKTKYANNPYLSQQGRYNWGSKLDSDFYNSDGNVREAVYNAAKQNKLNPALLFSSAMEEGMSGSVDEKSSQNASQAYVDWTGKNPDNEKNYPVDGFYNYGLDQFAGQAQDLEKKGYLPKGFNQNYTTFQTKNEKGETLNAPAFNSDANALMAKSAMMRQSQDQLEEYEKQNKVNLTPEQKDFFLLANYNAGKGNMQKMIKSYQDKGYLKDNKFLDPTFKPASYSGVYNNVQARLQSAKELQDEGYFKDYNNGAQPTPIAPTKQMAAVPSQGTVVGTTMQYGGQGTHDLLVGNLPMAKTGWIQGAINPAHKGYCTPMTKATCTPRRKALARRFKSGDLHKGQAGGDLYNDVPQYEIDNNLLMQTGGSIQQVEGLQGQDKNIANVEAERGEVYTDLQGNMNQVDTSGATHEQGGEMLPQVHRVLENTSNLRGDKISKYLKLAPVQIKALTGLDTNKSMSHAEALMEGVDAIEKQKQKIVSKIQLAAKGGNLDTYAENSTKLNIDHFRAMPTKDELFNRLFDHQELTKQALGINNDGSTGQYGGKYIPKAQTGLSAYPGNKSGMTTPAGNPDAFPNPPGTLDEYLSQLKTRGFKFQGINSNTDLQKALYEYQLKNDPQAIRNMWQEGVHQAGMDRAIKAGFVYDKDDASKGIRKGQFKPGVLDDPANLQKLAEIYPDNILGKRILQLATSSKGPKVWTDQDIPQAAQTSQQAQGYQTDPRIRGNINLKDQPKSDFNEPLHWYDVASPIGTYLAGSERIAEKYNPAQFHQLQLKLLDPTAALQTNQADFNAALQATQQANPYDVGTQMANIANLASRKYALNNQVLGNYENQNAQIKNQEIQYNTQVRDKQSLSDQQSREAFEEKVLTGKAKQQEQKLTALDSLYKTIAENAALNRNGNLIMKMSRAFDQYGNYNGYAPSFQPNPTLGIAANPAANPQVSGGKYQPAGGIQGLTPGKSYYNRRTGKTMRFDGTNLTEIK